MIADKLPPNQHAEPASLLATLADRACRSTPKQLEAVTVLSVIVIAVIAVLRPTWWEIGFPFAAAAAFGVWGLIEHNRESNVNGIPQERARLTSIAQHTLAAIGVLSAVGAFYALVGILIGTVVS